MSKLILPARFSGADDGYNQAADLITQTADGADLNRMWQEFRQTVDLLNRDRTALLNLLTYRVGDPVEQVRYPSGDRFEEASEFGVPTGMRLGPAFNMGFGFKWYDLAIRYTWQYLAEATQAELEALNNQALEASTALQLDTAMRALFNNVNEVASINGQAVNVYRLYNNDGTTPPAWKTYTHASTHNHYLASGAATIDSGDLDAMETHLVHHGYSIATGMRFVLLVNRQEAQVVKTFRVASGDTYDFIPAAGVGGGVILNGTVVGAPSGTLPGQIGTYGPWIVIEEDLIPAGYVAGFATGGRESIGNPVGIREHANASLRGLRLVRGPQPDYPLIDSYYQQGIGAGVRHRGAGVVMQITAGSYTIPAAYA